MLTSDYCFYRILDHINALITNHDLASLLELWKHFDTKIFSRLESSKVTQGGLSHFPFQLNVIKICIIALFEKVAIEKTEKLHNEGSFPACRQAQSRSWRAAFWSCTPSTAFSPSSPTSWGSFLKGWLGTYKVEIVVITPGLRQLGILLDFWRLWFINLAQSYRLKNQSYRLKSQAYRSDSGGLWQTFFPLKVLHG